MKAFTVKGVVKRLRSFDAKIKAAFSSVREELDDHLRTINENTNELQSNYEYICEIDAKIEKLSERLDEIQMMLTGGPEEVSVQPLTMREREVFLVIYSNENTTYEHIGRRVGLPESMVRHYIMNLIRKGVPVIRKLKDDQELVCLDAEFRTLQAKENIVGINESMSMSI